MPRETREPDITISGVKLTTAQSMTLRVAVGHWMMDLTQDKKYIEGLGPIGEAYKARLTEIQALMRLTTV